MSEGVLAIRVRSRENRWVVLPYRNYYGRARDIAGDKRVKAKHYPVALEEAEKAVQALQAQNPGLVYQIVRPADRRLPGRRTEAGLVWVPVSRDSTPSDAERSSRAVRRVGDSKLKL